MNIKILAGEKWQTISFKAAKTLRRKYAVSNLGRIASFTKNIYEDGKILTGSLTSGYRTLNLHVPSGNGTLYIHREVAKLFCEKSSAKKNVVIHINYLKADNRSTNLVWKTAEEANEHQQKSPKKLAYKAAQGKRKVGAKLSLTQVKAIKKHLANSKRKLTYKQLAEKFKVSEMTIYRIKSGENWGQV